MNAEQLRYLSVLYRHLSGPLKVLATEPSTAHLLKAMAGVMVRLVAGGETETTRVRRLIEATKLSMAELPPSLRNDAAAHELRAIAEAPSPNSDDIEAALADLVQKLSSHPGTERQRILERLVAADWECWNEIEAAREALLRQKPMQAEASAGTALMGNESALADWLREFCAESPDLEVSALKVIPGGFSKQTVFAQVQKADHIGEQVVLRVDRPESPLQTTVLAEYPLLKVLHAAGVRVPRPLALDSGKLIGAPVMAVEKLNGRVVADGQHFTEAHVPFSCATSLAREMAAYHQIPLASLPPDLPGSGMSVMQIMSAELQRFREIWRQAGRQSIVVEAAFIWLSENLHWAGEERGLVHGDMRFHNLLVDGGEVTALLDWEIASIGHPAFDLGYVYRHIVQLGSWASFLAAYQAAGGHVPRSQTLTFYAVRTELFTVVYLTRMAAAFQAGAFEKIELGYAGIELRQHAVFLLAERLRAAMAGEDL